jgi:hypothetical protein
MQLCQISIPKVSERLASGETLKSERSGEWPESIASKQGRILLLKY